MQQVSGDLVFFPRAPRYTGGRAGFWATITTALDYTVANLVLAGGNAHGGTGHGSGGS